MLVLALYYYVLFQSVGASQLMFNGHAMEQILCGIIDKFQAIIGFDNRFFMPKLSIRMMQKTSNNR